MHQAMETLAPWVALHLSALSGTVFTPARLMGTERAEKAERMAAAEKEAAALEKRMAKAKTSSQGGGTWRVVE